ncbi:hypothetical protein Tco_0746440 [Tanacetum coccineum]
MIVMVVEVNRMTHERWLSGDGEEDVVMGEGVVMASSSLEMVTKSFLGGMMSPALPCKVSPFVAVATLHFGLIKPNGLSTIHRKLPSSVLQESPCPYC